MRNRCRNYYKYNNTDVVSSLFAVQVAIMFYANHSIPPMFLSQLWSARSANLPYIMYACLHKAGATWEKGCLKLTQYLSKAESRTAESLLNFPSHVVMIKLKRATFIFTLKNLLVFRMVAINVFSRILYKLFPLQKTINVKYFKMDVCAISHDTDCLVSR